MLDPRGTVRLRPMAILLAVLAVALMSSTGRAEAAAMATTAAPTDAWIAAEADQLSARSVIVVCAATAQDWRASLLEVGLAPDRADEYYGFSLIERGEMHLSPYVCEGLRLGKVAAWRRQHELQVSWAVDVLIHEAVHLGRLATDEALTEACAREGLAVELHRLYGIAYRSRELARLTAAATWFRRTQGPAYQGGTCLAR